MEPAERIALEVDPYIRIDEADVVTADVTSIVQNWVDGDANYGVYVGANGTSNGWQIVMSESADPDLAPMLRVDAVPEPSTLLLAGGAMTALTLSGRRRRRCLL
ncbi:MAG: PEP-CTERM sorting domain-containing protein [Planctomycetota bacterium]